MSVHYYELSQLRQIGNLKAIGSTLMDTQTLNHQTGGFIYGLAARNSHQGVGGGVDGADLANRNRRDSRSAPTGSTPTLRHSFLLKAKNTVMEAFIRKKEPKLAQ